MLGRVLVYVCKDLIAVEKHMIEYRETCLSFEPVRINEFED